MDSSDEETRRRRSTDCIYFLASPLTCKKGSDCEYRHSDAARMNPRDCWYWFNGNCANPKCSFRHPPLDNLHGAPTTPRAPQQSAPQVPVPAQAHGSAASGGGAAKQGVPCYYFQKGMCAKGDRCAFIHVPQPAGNPSAPQPAGKVLAPNPQLKNSWTKPSSSPQHNMPPGVFDRSKVSAHDVKPAQKQNMTSRVDHSSRVYHNHSSSYLQSGAAKHHQPQPLVEDDLAENGMETGEFVREPSAGSGVLVSGADDGAEQTFKGSHNRTNGTGMMRLAHGGYESEKSFRSSAERLSSEKRIPQREPMPVTAGSSDLRHRLLKQRRLNNSSTSSSQAADRHGAHLDDERNGHHRWQGEEQAAHDGLSRSRLRDRIRLPGETSFDRLGSRSEKDRGPRSARLSPPKHTDLRGKLHERLKARSAEDILPGDAKGLVAKASGGEDAGSLNFAGPKSLAELKAKKVVGSSGEGAIKSIGSSRMTSEVVSSRESFEDPAPFEGPKPLSVILKRKREVASSEMVAHPETTQEEKEDDNGDAIGVEEEAQVENDTVAESMEGNGEEEEAFYPEADVAYDDDYNVSPVADDVACEEQQDVEAAAEDESAVQEQQDAEAAAEDEYEYEAADMNGEEDNEYQEYDEDHDDLEEDEEDFARKMGVMI